MKNWSLWGSSDKSVAAESPVSSGDPAGEVALLRRNIEAISRSSSNLGSEAAEVRG